MDSLLNSKDNTGMPDFITPILNKFGGKIEKDDSLDKIVNLLKEIDDAFDYEYQFSGIAEKRLNEIKNSNPNNMDDFIKGRIVLQKRVDDVLRSDKPFVENDLNLMKKFAPEINLDKKIDRDVLSSMKKSTSEILNVRRKMDSSIKKMSVEYIKMGIVINLNLGGDRTL